MELVQEIQKLFRERPEVALGLRGKYDAGRACMVYTARARVNGRGDEDVIIVTRDSVEDAVYAVIRSLTRAEGQVG